MTTDAPKPQIIQVNFTRKTRGHLKSVEGYRGLYKYPHEDGYYIRPFVDGRQREFKLKATTVSAAERERGKLIGQLAQYHAGLSKNPFARSDAITLRELCEFYLKQDCPRKNSSKAREGELLTQERHRVFMLSSWPGAKEAAETFTAERWRDYRDWRVKHSARAGKLVKLAKHQLGNTAAGRLRQVDKERATLSNIYRCAIRHTNTTGITINPVLAFAFERFRDPDQVSHCRDHMPRSGDELHNIARFFFNADPRSHVLGWQVLFAARIGQRCHELIRLRMDAQSKDQPGYIAGGKLYLFRSLTSKGTYGHADIDKNFQLCLDAHRAWHQANFPKSPWYFPSPEDPGNPIGKTALSHALGRVCPAMGLHDIWPHGLRAFRVNTLRSDGLSDPEIAIRIGHKTGGKLIVNVYGEGLDYKLTWMPVEGKPAWFALESSREPEYFQPELI